MIKLTRTALIKWFGYENEIIGFDNITYLTGKNSAGKSTLADAIQLVFYADTDGRRYFNKAANDRSQRTLKDYLYGTISKGNYIRSEQEFTSYVVLEFHDSETLSYFCAGFVADCHATEDRQFEHNWFIIRNGRIPDDSFVVDRTPVSRRKLPEFLERLYGTKGYEIFTGSNKSFKYALHERLGHLDPDRYLKVFQQAVRFNPITDIPSFIADYICKTDSSIDIEALASDVRQYKDLEAAAKESGKKMVKLEEISALYKQYVSLKETARINEYALLKAQVDGKLQEAEDCIVDIEKIEKDISSVESETEECLSQKELLEEERINLSFSLREKGAGSVEDIRRQLEQKRRERDNILADAERTISRIKERAARLYGMMHDLGVFTSDQFEGIENLGVVEIEDVDDECIRRLEKMEETVLTAAEESLDNLRLNRAVKAEDINSHNSILATLKNGQKPYPSELQNFLSEYRKRTGEAAVVLADAVEVTESQWQKAVETALGEDVYLVFTGEENLDTAKEIALGYENIRLFDGSRYEALSEAENPLYLLTSVDDTAPHAGDIDRALFLLLSHYETSESSQGHLYEAHPDGTVFRNSEVIYPSEILLLGRKAVELMIAEHESALDRLEAECSVIDEEIETRRTLISPLQRNMLTDEVMESYFRSINRIGSIDSLEAEISSLSDQLALIDTAEIDELRTRLEKVRAEISALENRIINLSSRSGALENELESRNRAREEALEAYRTNSERLASAGYDPVWVEGIAEPEYRKILSDADGLVNNAAVRLTRKSSGIREKKDEAWDKLVDMRKDFDNSMNARAEDNAEFDRELETIVNIDLPTYEVKISEAREKAQRQFEAGVINRLHTNIKQTQNDIKAINKALQAFSFGEDTYRFTYTADKDHRKFYEMLTSDLAFGAGSGEEQGDLFSESFRVQYHEQMEEMFKVLSEGGDSDADVVKYTDFRTYMSFDLEVTKKNGMKISLAEEITKKSGGETQVPFYIALLASLQQSCRMYNKDSNTCRLVIFDEAFIKMDEQRIKTCLEYLRKSGLQAIILAPTDKIFSIGLYVDKTLYIKRDERNRIRVIKARLEDFDELMA